MAKETDEPIENSVSHETGDRCGSTDTVIVGAGPIGIELAVELRRRNLDFKVIEAGPIGQTMAWWAPGTRWFSSNERIAIAGVPLVTTDQSKATREEYLTYLRSVVEQFDIKVRTFEKVIEIRRLTDDHESEFAFEIVSYRASQGASVAVGVSAEPTATRTRCKQIVLAIGGTDFPRQLGIPGESLPSVDGYLREPHVYHGRDVLIVGGRNSAAEAALRLHHAGARVAISYRGDCLPQDGIKYWLAPELNGLIAAGRIQAYFSTVPRRVDHGAVVLAHVSTGDEIVVPADDVLKLIGYEQDKSLLEQAGIELVDSTRRPAFDPATMQTNVPGIYVAGTAVAGTQSSKYKTFLENCHTHVQQIAADIQGNAADRADTVYSELARLQPES